MRIQEQPFVEDGVNLMPLIDVVFLLLIFFLVATTVKQEEREAQIKLPVASEQLAPMSEPPQQLIINILADGTVKVAGQRLSDTALREQLAEAANASPKRQVLIRCDLEAQHKGFARISALAAEVGGTELKVGYDGPLKGQTAPPIEGD